MGSYADEKKRQQDQAAAPVKKEEAPVKAPAPVVGPPPPANASPPPPPAATGRLNPLGGWVHPLMQIMSAIKSSPDPSLQDAAQEGKDIARSGANYFTANAADPMMARIGQNEPAGTPPWLRFNPDVQAQRAETAAARERLGALDKYGVAPTALGALMELTGGGGASLIPRMAAYRAGSTYQGGDTNPLDITWAGVKGGLEGTVPTAINKVLVGPLANYFGKRAYGADTPESIAATTQQQAEAAKEQLANIPVSQKDLGFSFTQGPLANTKNPTYSQLQDELTNFAKIRPEDDPSGAVPLLTAKINQAVSAPETQVAKTAADAAAAQATTAKQLADWNWQANVKGMDVPGQALDYLKANPGMPLTQRDAYSAIANAGVQGGSNLREILGATIGGAVGRGIRGAAGAFGLPAPGASEVGTYLGGKFGGAGPDATAATQEALANSYKALLPGYMPGALQSQIATEQAKQAMSQFLLGGPGTGLY